MRRRTVAIRATAAVVALALLCGSAAAGTDLCALDVPGTYAKAFDGLALNRRPSGDYLRRWYRPVIPVYVRNELDVRARPAIETALADYNRQVFGGDRLRLIEYEDVEQVPDNFMIPLGQSERTELDGIFISLIGDDRYANLGRLVDRFPGRVSNPEQTKRSFETSNCKNYQYSVDKRHETYHAVIWIRAKSFSHPIHGCLYHELDHALGLINHDPDVYCTVLSGTRETVDELKPLDRRVLEILYHPAIDTTKSSSDLRETVQRLAECAARQPSGPDGPRLAEVCPTVGK
jgi:hypothetical protein